jgi:hypothetical protein
MTTPPTNFPAADSDWPVLLLATLGAVTLAVAGLWLAVVTGAAWALVLAVVLVLVGVVALITVIAAMLDDDGTSAPGA